MPRCWMRLFLLDGCARSGSVWRRAILIDTDNDAQTVMPASLADGELDGYETLPGCIGTGKPCCENRCEKCEVKNLCRKQRTKGQKLYLPS